MNTTKIAQYTTKSLNAALGLSEQQRRLAALDTDPGTLVPSRYPSFTVAAAEIAIKVNRAARIAVARASQLDRLQALVGDRAELKAEETYNRWGSRPSEVTRTKMIRGSFATSLCRVHLASNADHAQDEAFMTVSLHVPESKLAEVLALLGEKIAAQ